MLYPKKQEKCLSEELFRNPAREYRGAPFWAWNCRLEKEELLWQLEVLKKMGMGGAHMHVRVGMETEYLSDEFMEMVCACVEKCREEDMLAWIYDEDRCPSGYAGGIVTKDPKYRGKFLRITPVPSEKEPLLACYDILLDERGCLVSGERIEEAEPARGVKWYAYITEGIPRTGLNNQCYVNTLDPAAIRRFIEVTYERYRQALSADLGRTVPAIFTDEPQFVIRKTLLNFPEDRTDMTLPWTDDLPRTFFATYGEDLVAGIPEILWELPDGKVSVTRYRYHEHTCRRFTEAFVDQCGQWCGENGVMLTGHMMGEESLQEQTRCVGEAMRAYRAFQLPGIDMLCDNVELVTAKQAQSAVHQYGREGMVSELYGVTGWHFDFRGHKFQGDWQAALGVTLRVHHLSWVSMGGESKRDYPASIHYQSPWWQDYAYVEDHFARINTALTRGRPVVRLGVIHPVESCWLRFGPTSQTGELRAQQERYFRDVTDWLLKGTVDFDFISEALLPELCEQGSNPLKVGMMTYDAIVVPGCETLRASTLERLEAFHKAGGLLIFLGEAPQYVEAVPSGRGRALWEKARRLPFEKEALLEALEPIRLVRVQEVTGRRTNDLICQLREDGQNRWLFLAHAVRPYHRDVPNSRKIRLTVAGHWNMEEYDTLTGQIHPLETKVEGSSTVLEWNLWDLDSLLLRLSPRKEAWTIPQPREQTWKKLPVPDRVEFGLDEPNVLLLDKAKASLDGGPWTEETELLRLSYRFREELGYPKKTFVQPWTIRETDKPHRVRLRFSIYADRAVSAVKIALEQGKTARVTLNGQEAGPADGWFTDKAIVTRPLGNLNPEENILEAEVFLDRRTSLEWCYLLGDFGVKRMGSYRELTAKPSVLGFGNVTEQGFAHYGGNITYRIPVKTSGLLRVTVSQYAGAAVRVTLDGQKGYVVYPPYVLETETSPGTHTLELTLLGHRWNCFGPVHMADPIHRWLDTRCWFTEGTAWTDGYMLKPLGILSAPSVETCEDGVR